MSTDKFCSQCGVRLPPELENCPQCLLHLGLELPPRDPEATGHVSAPAVPSARRHPDGERAPTIEEIAPLFPQLELLEQVGQGGMGIVYKARQRKLDRLVALKLLSVGADQPAFADRFLREARAMARLSHPHIVSVYDFGETDGRCWLLMEYVDGVNLRQALSSGQLTPEGALQIVPQICDALQCAHDLGVVHRDIKPENVLLDKRGAVKIADFGLAKLAGQAPEERTLTRSAQVMGTPHYMAPEQMRASHDVDHRADIFSLGVVFYEMLTGGLPIGNFERPSQKVAVDVRVDEIVLRALEHEPERRYQHAVDVKTAVETVHQEEAPEPAVVVSSWPQRLRRWRVRGIACGVLACCFLGAWSITQEAWVEREAGLAALGAGLLGAWYFVLRVLISLSPDLQARLTGAPRWLKVLRHAVALPLAVGGLLSLGAAIVWSWDEGTLSYRPEHRGSERAFWYNPFRWGEGIGRQLPQLESWADRPVPKIHTAEAEWLEGSGELIDIDPGPNAALGMAMIFAASLMIVITSRSRWSLLRCLGPALGATLVIPAWFASCAIGTHLSRLEPPVMGSHMSGSLVVNASLEQVHEQLRDTLWRYHYQTSWDVGALLSEGNPNAGSVMVGDAFARHCKILAEPASLFARWYLRWDGPYRMSPQLLFELTSLPDGNQCVLSWRAGVVPVRDGRLKQWTALVDEMLVDLPH